jgi:dTMP kinase
MRGRFITFEGGEGAGKSTQAKLLAARLGDFGIRAVLTREPGGSPGAEIIRHVLLTGAAEPLGSDIEAMLFAAARADHVDALIEPTLSTGDWVISDRFMDSTRVYQGVASEVDARMVRALERVAVRSAVPDLTLILDLPAEVGLARAAARNPGGVTDRFERETLEFHTRLRDAYAGLARDEPQRCVLISADGDSAEVARNIWAVVDQRFEFARPAKQAMQAAS